MHKVAISDHRVLAIKNRVVTYSWRDRNYGNKLKTDQITVEEFTKRFCRHIPAKGLSENPVLWLVVGGQT